MPGEVRQFLPEPLRGDNSDAERLAPLVCQDPQAPASRRSAARPDRTRPIAASLTKLVFGWMRRRDRLRRQAADPTLGWLALIRIRVLTFLITRYEGAPEPRFSPPAPDSTPLGPFCAVDDPADHPPRPPAAIAAFLRDISRCNAAAHPRWRFWP